MQNFIFHLRHNEPLVTLSQIMLIDAELLKTMHVLFWKLSLNFVNQAVIDVTDKDIMTYIGDLLLPI